MAIGTPRAAAEPIARRSSRPWLTRNGVGQRAAADADQRGDRPDHGAAAQPDAAPRHGRFRRLNVQQHPDPDRDLEGAEDAPQVVGVDTRGQPGPEQGPEDDPRQQPAHGRAVHPAPAVMGAGREDRGGDDRAQRGADRELHQAGRVEGQQAEDRDEHRHQDQPAADAEHAGRDAGDQAQEHEQQPQA